MVGLKDVAQASGLSITQVSRALNGKSDVSLATRQKVEKIAEDLGYVKNLTAQSLSAKQSNQLAVIVPGLDAKGEDTSFVIDTIRGINAFAKQHNYETVVHFIEEIPDSYEAYCRQRGVGGMIMFNVSYKDESFVKLQESDFPCVTIDVPMEGVNKGCVIVNNTYYASQAVRQLVMRGRKRIAMISGDHSSFVEIEREAGYCSALKQAGIPIDNELIVNADFKCEEARQETLKLMQAHPDIDAFFCLSDYMALGTISALHSLGYSLPDQISIFGFDGLQTAEFVHPKLSTIKQDHCKKGYQAAKLLTKIMRSEQTEGTVVVSCETWLRDSV